MNRTSKILIVDDNEVSLLIAENLLMKHNYAIDTATSGKEALSKIRANDYDLIIMDIMMPGMSGYDACSKIKELNPSAFIIMLTGLIDDNAFRKSFDAGAVDFIKKPIHELELHVRVKNALRMKNYEKSLQEKNQQLEILAATDGLTGLYNHRFIINSLTHNINITKRYSVPLSIIMFDIDQFKQFNDVYGHRAGDRILKLAADTFIKNLRNVDIVGRYGGEEFLIIQPNTNLAGSVKAAELLRKQMEKITLKNQVKLTLSISGGVCEYKNNYNLSRFISVADKLLYKAKKNGRNKIEY